MNSYLTKTFYVMYAIISTMDDKRPIYFLN